MHTVRRAAFADNQCFEKPFRRRASSNAWGRYCVSRRDGRRAGTRATTGAAHGVRRRDEAPRCGTRHAALDGQ